MGNRWTESGFAFSPMHPLEAMCKFVHFQNQHAGEIAYVVGKFTLAPMRQRSNPRLELLAARDGSRLKQLIVEEQDTPNERTFFGKDSKTVLQFMHRAGSNKRCLWQRVDKVFDNSAIDQFRHTAVKTADIGTRV